MSRQYPCEITNMVMIYDKKREKVLVINRKKKYKGISFCGGHVEKCESVYESAKREALEETGLYISSLIPCGLVHWTKKSGEKYLEFLYKTEEFSGEIKSGTDEGDIFWLDCKELFSRNDLSQNFDKYLPVFFSEGYTELYFEYEDDFSGDGTYYPSITEEQK